MAFHCSICGEESTGICVWCTKDTCANHLCERCTRCSDCCECEVPLREPAREAPPVRAAMAETISEVLAEVPVPAEAAPRTEAPDLETMDAAAGPHPEPPPLPEPMPEPPPEPPIE